jgi:hypothetical protein
MAETNLAERIRGIFMGHLRHQNPPLPRRVPARAAASGLAETELGSRPEWRLTELWHFRGVYRRRAQGCHVACCGRGGAMDSAGGAWQGLAVMAPSSYRIVDEPAPSALGRLITNPFWIVIAGMVGPSLLLGTIKEPQLLVLLWFGVNSFALSSPTRRAEIVWIAGGMAIIGIFLYLPERLWLSGRITFDTLRAWMPYLLILRSAVDLTVLYRLFLYQIGPYRLYRYLHPDRP